MKTTVTKWGKSIGIRIPRSVVDSAHFEAGQKLEVTFSHGVMKVQKPRYTLEELVAQITPENRHDLIDWGKPVGKEVW